MRKLLIGALCSVFLLGCTTPQRYVVDVAKTQGCEDFDWNGRVTVTTTWKGLLVGTTVDSVELTSRDGRTLLLDTRSGVVHAFTEVPVEHEDIEQPASDAATRVGPSTHALR